MRMPRFRIRTLMVAVAGLLTASGMKAWWLYRSSKVFRARAAQLGFVESMYKDHSKFLDKMIGIEIRNASEMRELREAKQRSSLFADLKPDPRERLKQREHEALRTQREDIVRRDGATARAEYYGRLKVKYEHAARYPWLPVEPDPPEPD